MARHQSQSHSQGFVLIATLLMLFLLSGIAVGVMMMTTSEIHIGSNDKEGNMAYYAAESGMEKLTSDLGALYGYEQSPSPADIQALTNATNYPQSAMVGAVTYNETITIPLDANGNPVSTASTISSGPNQGLSALITPLTMNVNALRPSGAAANITRKIEVAQIPVFQFGIFSESSLSFNNGANFGFGGRIHTNGHLFLLPQSGGTSMLGAKTTVFGEIIRDQLQNGAPAGGSFTGTPYQANATSGCDAAIAVPRAPLGTETNCVNLTTASASWSGGIPPAGSANSSWISTSTVSFNGFIGNNRSTGVQQLTLPFTKGGGLPQDIIRRPYVGESANAATGQSRMYNKANIRVILADTLQALHDDGSATVKPGDVLLTGGSGAAFGGDAVASADPAVDNKWQTPLPGAAGAQFPLVTGYLHVEIKNAANVWTPVTSQWLALGIGRNPGPIAAGGNPTAKTGPNPNAILVFQELASDNNGVIYPTRIAASTATNWYPINFFDPREGLVRDANAANSNCTVNGIMNAVELDMGNLKNWMTTSASGPTIEYTQQNGYVLYFSDRRGMLPTPRANTTTDGPYAVAGVLNGEYGFEDTVNVATSATGAPNGVDGGAPETGEDANGNGYLDTYGAANVGNGFRVATAAANYPYATVDCLNQGRMNWVSGARHVLRLIDGTVGNLPLSPNNGGLTVASENPVYIQGDYNASSAQLFTDTPKVHSPAAVIADAVTLLSNNWNDINDMTHPTDAFSRLGSNTWYRLAVASGKTPNFPNSGGVNDVTWGTDGGVHNFLRYIEAWDTAGGASTTLAYQGSLVSLYYSNYATGTYKFGKSGIYNAPNRQYSFDTLFLIPQNLPPATPMFQDVVNLSYRQDFTPY